MLDLARRRLRTCNTNCWTKPKSSFLDADLLRKRAPKFRTVYAGFMVDCSGISKHLKKQFGIVGQRVGLFFSRSLVCPSGAEPDVALAETIRHFGAAAWAHAVGSRLGPQLTQLCFFRISGDTDWSDTAKRNCYRRIVCIHLLAS